MIQELIAQQRAYYHSGQTRALPIRLLQLQKLYDGIQTYETKILDALKQDLNKSQFEAYVTEIGYTLKEISFVKKHLGRWMKPQKVKGTLLQAGGKGRIVPEPYGVTLIIAPWNYPFQLAMAPLIGAIAAGNTAIVKPSELTPHVSAVIAELLREVYAEEYIAVVEGGVEISTELLAQPFDHIFFTGSVAVGKIVMEAAAKRLTPVTLELGGKSPCIVHDDANLEVAARRIVWGKFVNAGQTCVAPDYVYVHKHVKDKLIALIREEIQKQYANPLQGEGYVRIVSERHFQRLASFLTNGNVLAGGKVNQEKLIIEPTLLGNVTWDDAVMQEEIFGPILPMFEYEDLDRVIQTILQHPKPLALYAFTESKRVEDEIVTRISYGGGCINDTIFHLGSPYLPFGGVGESGMGSYHGEYSFRAFSHYKSVLRQSSKFDLKFRYYPSESALKFIRKLLK
ncbi:aldehyde dehydrogenase [Ectobacillus antri]|uniref:Aldehyde dehydrogenase n=1 Tax=Ectobacillus antri TaxID=2486280 RepID=A0ABT6H5A7_9BACI|nr:aldehyde dehydrogenase [Ectobacillus antri]MDG4657494.1 aldehyde dehydrogenase [Ectobacillus antri]MDG5753807.1 aldehyde dehydrogenase [Ectobacillus antri]